MESGFMTEMMGRMEQIDEVARRTIALQQKRIPEKYSNIETTLKLLQNLIATYRKRADSYEQDLKNRAKIDDLTNQITFHRERLADCERLSQSLAARIAEMRGQVRQDERRVADMRRQIVELKTDNVKKILRIQEMERMEQRQRAKEHQENRKLTWKIKTQYNREFYQQLATDPPHQQQLDLLHRQKHRLTAALFARLEKRTKVEALLGEALAYMEGKLSEKERKANLNGMHGSLLFRMLSNNSPQPLRPLSDKKLMIYDVLKAKHTHHLKQERRATEAPQVTEQQFLQFSPLQVMGMIELEGGSQRLKKLIVEWQQQSKAAASSSESAVSIGRLGD